MRHRKQTLTVAIVLALNGAWAWATPAAQSEPRDGADSETKALEEVTVTARRREETLQDVPVAVTALTARQLDRLNVTDLGALQGNVPNLTIYAARGSNTTLTAYIRGVGQSDPLWGVDPGVGLYLDDVYVARPQGALLDVFDVERVEVLRGPQGTLYGKNTIGGAIKYVSRPLRPVAEGNVSVTLGSYRQADLKGAVNLPISESVTARLALALLNNDGFGENIRTGDPVSDKDTTAARFTLGFTPTDSFSVQLSADYIDDDSSVRGAQMLTRTDDALAPAFPPPVPFNRFDPARTLPLRDRYDVRSGMPPLNETTMSGAALTATWYGGGAWTLKSITAYRESETRTSIDFDTLPNIIADVRADYADDQFSQEFQANYDAGGTLRGVLGLYYFDGTAGGTVFNNFFNASFGTTGGEVGTESYAVYGEGTYDFGERFSLTAGLRYTSEEKSARILNRAFSNSTFSTPIATLTDINRSVDFNNLSPKVSLDYRLSDDVLLYVLGSRGFKSGGFNIRANVAAVPQSARPFDDEKVTSAEIGAKLALAEGRAYVNAAYFYNWYRDIQLSVFTSIVVNGTPTFFGDFTNAGKGHIQGVELEYAYTPVDGFNIKGHVAYLDAQYDEYIDRGVNVARLQRFTNAPEWQAGINFEYLHRLSGGGEISTNLAYRYQTEVIPTTDLSQDIKQPAYGVLNAGIIWRTGGSWSFALQGTNLLDEEYRTTGYNIPALGILTGFYGPPRQVSVTARYDFR